MMTTYKFKQTYGVDDMWSTSPYYGEWNTFHAQFGLTEAEYLQDISGYEQRIKDRNAAHLLELEAKGLLGKTWETQMTLRNNPMFDSPPEVKPGMESYRMVFLDRLETNKPQ